MALVGIIADRFAADGEIVSGGAERHTYQLARLASESGADVIVYQASGLTTEANISGLRVRSLKAKPSTIWQVATRQAMDDGCQRLHFQYLDCVPRLARGLRTSATHHAVHWDIPMDDHYAGWYPYGRLAHLYLKPWRRLQKGKSMRGLRRCSEVLADDTSLLRLVQSDMPELRNRICVVPNFSDIAPNVTGSPTECHIDEVELAKQQGRFLVLIPRNLSFKQGIAFLPEVVRTVSQETSDKCQFVVTGQFLVGQPQSTHFRRRLDAELEKLPPEARARLTFLEGVRHDCMPYCYEAADIVLLPSYASEGMPLSAIEAMMFGRAVVATNVGGLNDLIDDGFDGILVQPNAEALADGICRLIRDPQLRSRLGREAQTKAAQRFSLEKWRSSVLGFMQRNEWMT